MRVWSPISSEQTHIVAIPVVYKKWKRRRCENDGRRHPENATTLNIRQAPEKPCRSLETGEVLGVVNTKTGIEEKAQQKLGSGERLRINCMRTIMIIDNRVGSRTGLHIDTVIFANVL